MKKYIIHMAFLLFVTFTYGRVGVGVSGGVLYPGFMKSDPNNSRFIAGAGYDFFLNHKLIRIKNITLLAQYCIRNYFCDIDLTIGKIRFQFNYLSIDITTTIITKPPWEFYGGGGTGLLTISGSPRYTRPIDEVVLIPEIISGISYSFGSDFNLFAEFLFQFGSFKSESITDVIPITGVRFVIGGTMFLSSE